MKVIVVLLLICFDSNVKAQSNDSIEKFKPQCLNGYFILIRDSIPYQNSDDNWPTRSFDKHFIPANDNNIVCDFKSLSLDLRDSVIFVAGSTDWLLYPTDASDYREWLTKKNYSINSGYSPFDLQKIPKEIIDSKQKFISVYKGNIEVIGSFLPYTKFDIINQKVYLYYPSNTNKTEYLFTIIFPSGK